MADKKYTSKQMGDACEMLVAAELTLAGIPAIKAPDLWPGYDVIAQPRNAEVQRISVKSRTFKRGAAFVGYRQHNVFDWLAIVLLNCEAPIPRRIFLVPRKFADKHTRRNDPATKNADGRYWRIDEVPSKCARFENNFSLKP